MALHIYNTLARKKEAFQPCQEGHVKMYVCGPTVYDLLHVGNFRGVIFFNLVRNWLERLNYQVTFVYNYTDIDDKIINRAKEEQEGPLELSARYIEEFEKDFAALKLKAHDHNPKATEFIKEMMKLIEELIEKKKAYVIGGEVFYSIESFVNYGKLSHKNIEELKAGHRVDFDPKKKSPMDFVLWKPSKDGEPGWESPWGYGRPGWHTECSTMIRSLLGESIDIHGGGLDLIFPHHENEIAQSEGATEKPFVRYWMHNNFINFGDAKMSKSLGNIVKGRDFIEKYHPEVLKYLMLSVHYRSPLNLAEERVQQSIVGLARIYSALALADQLLQSDIERGPGDSDFQKILNDADQAIADGFNDDFNTPAAFAAIFDVVRAFNASCDKGAKVTAQVKARAEAFKDWIHGYGLLMSLFEESPKEFLRKLDIILLNIRDIAVDTVEKLVVERTEAREKKDFSRSDAIRDQLKDLGVDVHDLPSGTSWEVHKG